MLQARRVSKEQWRDTSIDEGEVALEGFTGGSGHAVDLDSNDNSAGGHGRSGQGTSGSSVSKRRVLSSSSSSGRDGATHEGNREGRTRWGDFF